MKPLMFARQVHTGAMAIGRGREPAGPTCHSPARFSFKPPPTYSTLPPCRARIAFSAPEPQFQIEHTRVGRQPNAGHLAAREVGRVARRARGGCGLLPSGSCAAPTCAELW